MAFAGAYQPPKYLPQSDDDWYHVLYGHVPGYQLDFILRPQLPFQKLKLQHFSDLQLVIRHLRPPPHYPLAFAICNLSAHDTQHRPGHGALAIVAAVRLQQTSDHAGRVSPVFSHAAVLVDQPVLAAGLSEAACQFMRRFRRLGPEWYKTYYDENRPLDGLAQSKYVQRFADLPAIANDAAQIRWRVRGHALSFAHTVIRCPERQSLDSVLDAASRIAAILYHSRVRWLSIGNGDPTADEQLQSTTSEAELTVRFIYSAELDSPHSDGQTQSISIDQLPTDEQDLAAFLGLIPVVRTPAPALYEATAPASLHPEAPGLDPPASEAGAVHSVPPPHSAPPVDLAGRTSTTDDDAADQTLLIPGHLLHSATQEHAWPSAAELPLAQLAEPIDRTKRRSRVPLLIFSTVAVVLLGVVLAVVGPDRVGKLTAVNQPAPSATPEPRPSAEAAPKPAEVKQHPPRPAKVDPQTETKPAPQAAAKPEPKAPPKSEPKVSPKSSPKPEPKTSPKSPPKAEPKSPPKPESKAPAKSKPEPKAPPKSPPKPKPEPKTSPKSPSKPEPKASPKSPSKPETQGSLKSPFKPETQGSPKSSSKPESQGLAKGDPKRDLKPKEKAQASPGDGAHDQRETKSKAGTDGEGNEGSPEKGAREEGQAPSSATKSTEGHAESEQAVKQARQAVTRCEKSCEDAECKEKVTSVRANISDHAKANKGQLAAGEVKQLCDYCPEALPDYCKQREQ